MTLERWHKLTEWPLTLMSVVFIVAYSYEVVAQPVGTDLVNAEIVVWATWATFVVDYVVSLWLAPDRKSWFWAHLIELAVVVLPMLRPLRLLRAFTIVGVLNRTIGAAFRGKVLVYVGGSALLLVYLGGLSMLEIERAAGGNIDTLWAGVWWAFTSITTVNNALYYPVTFEGQLLAVAVMIGGIALVGAVTATMASWIVERVQQREAAEEQLSRKHIDLILDEVRALRAEVESLRSEQLPRTQHTPRSQRTDEAK
ncbi:MAG TPA: potassium channel family protein [Microbacteriaceae bacterium]|nr:potassium channel family protein [Microbacteriaceae bacterium]